MSGICGEAACENRRDGRVGATGKEAVAAERGEADGAGDERVEADMRLEAAKSRGGHLLGDRDRRQR